MITCGMFEGEEVQGGDGLALGIRNEDAFLERRSDGVLMIPSRYCEHDVIGIRDYGFLAMDSLREITLPEGVTTIGEFAFAECRNLERVCLPSSLVKIGNGAFAGLNCELIFEHGNENFRFEDGILLDQAGKTLYAYCGAAKRLSVPDTVRTIAPCAFAGNQCLEEVVIPDSVATLGEKAFWCCLNLKRARLSNALSAIPDGTFWDCGALIDLEFPHSKIGRIGANGFAGCTSLERFKINSTVEIGAGAFCRFQGRLIISGLRPDYFVEGDALYDRWGRLNSCLGSPTEFVAAREIKEVCDYAFGSQQSLRRVELPATTRSLGNNAFESCAELNEFKIRSTSYLIGESCFKNCASLREFELPSSLATIAPSAFEGCEALRRAVVPEGVTKIETRAFFGCSALSEVVLPNTLTSIESNAFENCASLQTLATPSSLNTIGEFAFRGCNGLKRLQFNEGLQRIGGAAFNACGSITRVIMPKTLRYIGSLAFYNNIELKELRLNEGLETIDECAFNNCEKLRNVYIPGTVGKIGGGAFTGIAGGIEISADNEEYRVYADMILSKGGRDLVCAPSGVVLCEFPSTIAFVEPCALSKIKELDIVKFNSDLSAIGSCAFQGSRRLEMIASKGRYVFYIEPFAFYCCESLAEIPFKSIKIYADTYYGCASLPSSLDLTWAGKIESGAFSGIYRLTDVKLQARSTVDSNVFDSGTTLHIAGGLHKTLRKWQEYAKRNNVNVIFSLLD